ncbi:hypothetical protein RI129_001902 [Pyrocoelia pectoralis]|uniref:Uncharacterized protein n=1 Tax=Pyrocoelia pectoralis TaxID=417401 RepID=A0AAN7ZXW5_9COLE
MVQIVGHYKLDRNENFAEYLEALGSPNEMIKKVTAPGATTEIIQEGKKYTIKSNSQVDVTLVLDEEVDEVLPTGVPIKNLATRDGNNIVVNSSAPDNRKRSRIYEFSDDGYIVTLIVGDLIAKRFFSRM